MTYISGICNNVNPGPTLYGYMAPALTSAGFTLVDTVVIATRTHQVWKSAAASNTANKDWYLDIGYPTTGTGRIALHCFEFYDPATHLGYRGLYSASGTTIDPTTSSRYGATGYALETNWVGGTAFTAFSINLVASGFNYYISITTNRVTSIVGNDPAKMAYVGLYTPDAMYSAKAGSDLYPLTGFVAQPSYTIFALSDYSDYAVSGALTRVPPLSSLPNGWGSYFTVQSLIPLLGGQWLGQPQTAYPVVAAPLVLTFPSGNGSPTSSGAVFGIATDVAFVLGGSAVAGDTVTVAGSTYVLATAYSITYGYGSLMMKAI